MTILPLPTSAASMDVTDMNDDGLVVGYVTVGQGTESYRGFIWTEAGGYTALGSLVGPDGISMALSVNDAGDVNGLSEGPHSNLYGGPMGIVLGDAFVWNAKSGMKSAPLIVAGPWFKPSDEAGNLTLPMGANCFKVVASNAVGQAIGYAGSTGGTECKFTSALRWESKGTFVVIGGCGPRAWCSTTLSAINSSGTVVGYSEYGGGFRWTASEGMDLIPMANAAVQFINDNGDAAGYARIGELPTPMVWTASGEIKVIKMPSGATYGFPVGINNKGHVVGSFE
ncbi:MAG TPA: hypothetical protein VM053_01595 [Gemmatimonadaceae bacterium]|nr:hypothetical protein [Gemmatimonadaceae bacterium]